MTIYVRDMMRIGCNRRTIADTVTVLRGFFRYAEEKGLCNPGLVYSLKAPRVYAHENLPSFVPLGDSSRYPAIQKRMPPGQVSGIMPYCFF